MRLTPLVGAALGTSLLFLAAAGGAQAYDRDRDRDYWRHQEWHHDHRHENRYMHERPVVVREPQVVVRERPVFVREPPVVVRERPVYVEQPRPVFVQPAPMYAAPMYQQQSQAPSSLNLNFNIPLN